MSAFWDYAMDHLRHQTRHSDVALAVVAYMSAYPNRIRGDPSDFFSELRQYVDEPEQYGKSPAAVADGYIADWIAAHPHD